MSLHTGGLWVTHTHTQTQTHTHLCEALLASGTDFGDGGDDFAATSWCDHLGGQEGDWTVGTCRGRSFTQSVMKC